MKFGRMIGYYPGTIGFDFGIDRVKVKVIKRSTSSFYHSTVNFYPIGMQLMPKCSEFNAQSCDMRRYALYRVPVLVLCVCVRFTMAQRRGTVFEKSANTKETGILLHPLFLFCKKRREESPAISS